MADLDVKNKRGMDESLGSEADTKLLDVRVFDEKVKLAAYGRQQRRPRMLEPRTARCAQAADNNATRIYGAE